MLYLNVYLGVCAVCIFKLTYSIYLRCLFSAFIKSSLISMRKIKRLQEEFQQNESSATGEKLRVVSGRALELVDEVFLSEWRQKTSSCQVETSSFTLKIPSQIPA